MRTRGLGVLALLAACGCGTASSSDGGADASPDGSRKGPDTGDDGDAGGDGECDGSRWAKVMTLPSLGDECDGVSTLTGNQLLSLVAPGYAATFTTGGGASGSALSITFTYDHGSIVCNPAKMSETGMSVPAELDVTMSVTFVTSDGLFHESFDATVSLVAMEEGSLRFDGTVPVSAIQGTFKPTIGGSWPSHVVDFSGTLSLLGADASADAGVAHTNGSATEQAFSSSGGRTNGVGGWM